MKKLLIYLTALIVMISCVSAGTLSFADFNAEDFTKELRSGSYYMMSLDNESVMFTKNPQKKTQPAAFAKVVAAIVAIEEWGDLSERVEVTLPSLLLIKYDYGVRSATIKTGDVFTKKQLIDCMLVYSANDAESIIAYNIAKTKEAYCDKMNAFVKKLGCKNTNFTDIFGFDAENQHTTAEDVAKIIRYGLKNSAFAETFSMRSVTLPATSKSSEKTFSASNRMTNSAVSDYYHSSVNGGKQTSTEQAGECIAVTSSMDGYSYLTVVMNGVIEDIDEDGVAENTCMTDAKKLLSWTYSNIRFRAVASPGQVAVSVPVQCARKTDYLNLTPEKEVTALVPANMTSHSVLVRPIEETMKKKITAPVKQGEVICEAEIVYANEVLAKVNLVAAEDVSLSVVRLVMKSVAGVLRSKLFIALEVAAIIVLVCYAVAAVNHKGSSKKPALRVLKNDGAKSGAQTAEKFSEDKKRPFRKGAGKGKNEDK